jgi:hypothetical protein
MTRLRALALSISHTAVRHASPGCKEWAEGLAREIAFIEGDWRALGWAIGSLRVLLQNPPKPLRNAAEIAQAARLFAGSREHMPPLLSFTMAVQAFTYGLRVVLPAGRIADFQRASFALAAISAAYLAVVSWIATRMSERPETMDDGAWIEFYRREMVRLRNLYNAFGALYLPALALLGAGAVLGYGRMARLYLTLFLAPFCLFIVWLGPRPAERLQRKIDNLDAILQQRPSQP